MTKKKPKVKLVGRDGNAFAILGHVVEALRKAGYSKGEISRYTAEAMCGDYANLIRVTSTWVEIR